MSGGSERRGAYTPLPSSWWLDLGQVCSSDELLGEGTTSSVEATLRGGFGDRAGSMTLTAALRNEGGFVLALCHIFLAME